MYSASVIPQSLASLNLYKSELFVLALDCLKALHNVVTALTEVIVKNLILCIELIVNIGILLIGS